MQCGRPHSDLALDPPENEASECKDDSTTHNVNADKIEGEQRLRVRRKSDVVVPGSG